MAARVNELTTGPGQSGTHQAGSRWPAVAQGGHNIGRRVYGDWHPTMRSHTKPLQPLGAYPTHVWNNCK
ncbi:hypothetical protein P171DRAFT_481449 [Karstenula rhodostoma CBS 690.94]|uniref:Uncharacterized protein n=1 Tax=Karstenula rhodostoma CBS 690.94 TaxID=1392251 RepID=A0A9P4PT74_9PLEO|nr:hypothetical protein P171DRAFT_481449 [Karstenula rhodostoma CBS 690.94]